jgi:hypothetical protein
MFTDCILLVSLQAALRRASALLKSQKPVIAKKTGKGKKKE